MKRIRLLCTALIATALVLLLSSCDFGKIIKHFDDWIKTTEDGFTYYYNEGNNKGAFILGIPDTEELTIPEYVDGKKVVELGHLDRGMAYSKEYRIAGKNTKKLTIQHQFDICYKNYNYYADFPNLTNLTFIDFLYCNQSCSENELLVPHYIGQRSSNVPIVELRKSDREYSLAEFKAKVILIPDYVEIIEAGVFDGLTDVTIKTSYESQPEGWEDGWNGSCEVVWGEEITYLYYYDWIKTTEDGFKYYYNDRTGEGVYLVDVPQNEKVTTIPEYINGKKVIKIAHRFNKDDYYGVFGYGVYGREIRQLTVQHQFDVLEDMAYFPNLTNLIYLDFLYCSLSTEQNELVVPYYIGTKDYYESEIPIVELRKSDREYSLENFKPTVIVIPEYVKVIEKGVFDGLTNVTIKTSYESQPEGWEDGWNGNCEVMWGEKITKLDHYDWIKTTEDGFTYYYNDRTGDGVYLLGVPQKEEVTIPEYINGKKVKRIAEWFGNKGYGVDGTGIRKLTIQHDVYVYYEEIVCFSDLTNLIYLDFLYCNLSTVQNDLVVPYCIGTDNYAESTIPTVELRKTGREYSLENFRPTVIVIPEYVKVIEKGVFDGLTNVTIKTPYESKPEGWEDGWNGSCEVIWGAN